MVQFRRPKRDMLGRIKYALFVCGTMVPMLIIVQVEEVTDIANISTQIIQGNLRRHKLRPIGVENAELLDVKGLVVINTAQIKINAN